MSETRATTNTPEQKASRCIIEKCLRKPGKAMGTPEQKANEVVPRLATVNYLVLL
jgi:hypothetical protein